MINVKYFKKSVSVVILITALTPILSMYVPQRVYAYIESAREPAETQKTQAQLNGYSEEAWAALMDNNLNYDEIDELVKNFNPSVSFAVDNYNKASYDILTNINELRAARMTMDELADLAKESNDLESYYMYKAQISAFNAMIKNMNKSRESLAKPISEGNKSINKARHQMSSAVKNVMISYKNIETQEETLNELVKLNKSLMAASEVMLKAGVSINADYTKAQSEVESAQAQLTKLSATKEQLRRNLIMFCGWQPDAMPVIGDIPQPDISHIDQMNPDTDIVKAIGNNYILIEGRNTKSKKSLGSYNAKVLTVQEQEDKLKVKLHELYNKVLSAKTAYEAAKVAYEGAQLNRNAADTKLKVGTISQVQYIGEGLTFTQKKAELKSAELDLSLAIFEYDDAVAGNVSIDGDDSSQ